MQELARNTDASSLKGDGVISCFVSGSDACLVERAADSLNSAGIDTKPRGDLAHSLCPSRGFQGRTDSIFQLGRYGRPPQPLALSPGSREPSADSFLKDGPLELGKYPHHLEEGFACGSCGVEALL